MRLGTTIGRNNCNEKTVQFRCSAKVDRETVHFWKVRIGQGNSDCQMAYPENAPSTNTALHVGSGRGSEKGFSKQHFAHSAATHSVIRDAFNRAKDATYKTFRE